MMWWLVLIAVYVVTALWSFRTILRTVCDGFEPRWGDVGLAATGLIPGLGVVIALAIVVDEVPATGRAVPEWLRAIGGVK